MMDAMEWLPQTKACFGCGHGNPAGVALRMKTDGKAIHAQWVPEVRHAGFSHAIHGGVITTVLDEMMAWACGILGGTFAFTAFSARDKPSIAWGAWMKTVVENSFWQARN